MKTLLFVLAFSFIGLNSFAQHVGGNGGGEALIFKMKLKMILNWIETDKVDAEKRLSLSENNLTADVLLQRLREADRLVENSVVIDDQDVSVMNKNGSTHPRICSNKKNPAQIFCNLSEWNKLGNEMKFYLVLHEYLGIADIESDDDNGNSRDPISKNVPFAVADILTTWKKSSLNQLPNQDYCTGAIFVENEDLKAKETILNKLKELKVPVTSEAESASHRLTYSLIPEVDAHSKTQITIFDRNDHLIFEKTIVGRQWSVIAQTFLIPVRSKPKYKDLAEALIFLKSCN